jgi:Thiol:disulfide interchange protein DsbD, N-terminal
MKRLFICLLLAVVPTHVAAAQEPGQTVPTVEVAPVGKVQVRAGATAKVEIDFRIGSEFHINSNKPKSELLIPTTLRLNATDSIKISSVTYPAGQDMSFPFAPTDKLSVYSGDFTITTVVKTLPTATAGTYPVSGELHFQACDRSACYPPKSIPVKFEVTVLNR